MPVVSIRELGLGEAAPSAADGTRRSSDRIFLATNHAADHESPHQWFEIPTTPLELMDEVRWYLEKFAVVSPLETKRADRAKQLLKDVGRVLVKSIDWASIVGPQGRNETLLVSVQERPRGSAPIVWELLEDPELWDEPFKGGVFVTRHVPKPPKTPIEAVSTSMNILIVAARDSEEEDIPHRIVSKVLHRKIRAHADRLALPASLKILRPPTWEEFNKELETKGAGFYDIVHFDLHGEKMDDNRQGLAFVDVTPDDKEPGKFNLTKRMVSTSDLASVLARYRVRRVVLNACRSAHYRDADDSIALGILRAGVEECVAMTFNVVSRAVEIFMAIFYDAILTKGLALDAAAAWARQALRLIPERESRYATRVPVYDFTIPVCYTRTVPRDSNAYHFTGRSLQYASRPPPGDIIGREGDILALETQLLASEKWLWLCGRPGVGKTALLRHLSVWWTETGLATGVYLYDCSAATSRWSVDGFWRGAHDAFLPTAEYQGPGAVVEYLRQNRSVLMFDNLPAQLPERPWTRFVAQVLKKLDPRSTMVILAARSDRGWDNLDQYFEPRREHLGGLSKLGSLQMLRVFMEKAIQDITGQPPKALGESSDDLQCFEQLGLLLAGNPAALRVVVAAFLHSKANTMKEFLASLILGEPLLDTPAAQQHIISVAQTEGIPCVMELLDIIKSLAFPPAGKFAVPVEMLTPFWGLLPRSDLPVIAGAYADQVSKDLSDDVHVAILAALAGQEGKEVPGLATLSPELKTAAATLVDPPDSFLKSLEFRDVVATMRNGLPPTQRNGDERLAFLVKEGPDYAEFIKGSPLFPLFSAACARIVDPLEAAHFLAVSRKQPRGHSMTNYYDVHPLLPLLLRTSPMYHFYGTEAQGIKTVHVKEALIFYYTYRARTWPIEHQYFEPEWRGVCEELRLEFMNFVSALAMHSDISKDLPDITMKIMAVLPMAMVLQRGVGTEISRFQLVHLAQETALDFVLTQEKRVSNSVEASSDPEKLQILFLLRMYGSGLASLRRLFVGVPTSEENRPFAALGRELYQRLKQMDDTAVQDIYDKAGITPATLRYLDRWQKLMADPALSDASAMASQEMWNLRQDFMRESAAVTGDTLYASQKTWDDVPGHALSGGRLKLELFSAMQTARSAMDSGQFAEARKILDKAWKHEVFERNGDGRHKAWLLRMRAEICERTGDWESGALHRDEARRLDLEVPPRSEGLLGMWRPGERWKQSLVEGLFDGSMAEGLSNVPFRGPWAAVYFWQLLTTPMEESELWVAIFVWQLMTAPSQEPWMAIFFWRPMASPAADPWLWTGIVFWLVMQAVTAWLEGLSEGIKGDAARQADGDK